MRLSSFVGTLILAAAAALPARADITIHMLEPIVKADVDLTTQRMRVTVNGEEKHVFKISSGRAGYATPTGTFNPYRMHTLWRSRKYNNAPMPYAVFYDRGFAVHGTNAVSRLGRPASHGCIRLRTDNAKKFFDLVLEHGRNRTEVKLTGGWKFKYSRIAAAKKKTRKRRNWNRTTGRTESNRFVVSRQRQRASSRGFFNFFN